MEMKKNIIRYKHTVIHISIKEKKKTERKTKVK